ncbi:hypothetical protein D6779_10165 [Candidatus Parcubacteria bacterium]|nr:MAG: hypothetical protein D6779_10165 [Candidatus Parcubacteria bacterium]
MERPQVITSSILSVASVLVSCIFVIYGAGVLFSEEVPKWIVAFGAVTAAYGLCSLAVLIMAWRRYGAKEKKIMKYLAIGFMVVFFLGSLDVGMVSGLEATGLLLVALMLFINWLAVNAVVKLRNVA